MNVLWVILNEEKNAVLESFETRDPDSKPHWDKFLPHRPGVVFCQRKSFDIWGKSSAKWYVNHFYWNDTARWGYGPPDGIGWSACMAIPEILKMVEFLR